MTDTNAVDRMGSLFNDFLAAAEAIKQRPQLEAKVSDAEAQRDRAQAEARFANERLNEEQSRNDTLRTKVAQLEADLAQATFREKEARGSMELVLGALKDTMTNAKAAVELVEPPPPPVVQITPEPEVTVIEQPFPWNRPMSPSPSAIGSDVLNTPDGTTTPDAYQSTGNGNDHPTSPGGTGAGDATPTLSAVPTVDALPVPVEVPVSKFPYSNKPYWIKPDSVTWSDWVAGGGDLAPWVRETDWVWTHAENEQRPY